MVEDIDAVETDALNDSIDAGASRKRRPVVWVGGCMVLVALAAVAMTRLSGDEKPAAAGTLLGNSSPAPRPELVPADSAFRGDKDAKVTIVEFADFECEFCARHASQTLPALMAKYGDKVRYVFRHYPLVGVHPQALGAAYAAECANRQDKFWAYHDRLFSRAGRLGREDLDSHAKSAGLDVETFARCMDKGEATEAVQRDISAATQLALEGTPAFVINGDTRIVGAKSLDVFQQAIDPLLD